MNISKQLLFTFILLVVFSFSARAEIDQELVESQKCASMFSYFEKKHNMPEDLLHAISLRETQKQHSKHNIATVWPWTVNVGGKGYYFKSKDEAISFVRKKMAEGKKSIDVGCMQINLKHHPEAFDSLEEAFSPKKNVAYSAKMLEKLYSQSKNWKTAIGAYHAGQGTGARAEKYRNYVTKVLNSMPTYKKALQNYLSPDNNRKTLSLAYI